MIKTLFKHISKYYKDTFILAIAGVAVGVLVGIVDAAFGLGLNACTAIRTKYFWYLIWFLPLGGVFIWFIYHQFGKSVANGMKMVFHVGLGKNNKLPIRMVPLAIVGTWTTHLFGGSAGREGVAVQIGAAVSNNVGRLVDKTIDIENSRKMFLITGMAAGFSGLFCTPLAAIFFALEVLVAGKLEYHALIPATVASISAAFTSRALGLRKFHINILETLNYHPSTYDAILLLKLAAMGLAFGIVGSLFALILRYLRLKFAFRFSSPVKKVVGLKGIKLHPDYQDTYFDDIRYERIIDRASELGLITVVHAGADPKCPDDVHCTPQMARKVIDEVRPENLVLAHMGGLVMWDEVEKYLVGQDVYFDTGVVLDRMPQEQFIRMVRSHGADRILFGTDSPWADQKNFVTILNSMPLTSDEREAIFSGNAMKLLGL